MMLRAAAGPVLEELPAPSLEEGDILVQMEACGLCGTDIEKIHGEYTAALPVLGHEAVGIVAEIGEGVEVFRVGDRVFPHHHTPCRRCHFCSHGSETMCLRYRSSNLDPGGFAEFFRVPAFNIRQGGVLRLPETVSFEAATLIEPVGCCVRGLSRCGVSESDSVLVIGAGPMGAMHIQLLNRMGAEVFVSELNPMRLGYAEKMGTSHIYDAGTINVPSAVKADTGGRGVDVALVAAGNPKTIIQALKSVRNGGTVCLFGVPVVGSILDYDFSDIFNSETNIVSSYGATELETKEALRLIDSGHIDPDLTITHRFRLAEFGNALRTAANGECLKIVITP
jgi:L-iditol 2-dehydrogenase